LLPSVGAGNLGLLPALDCTCTAELRGPALLPSVGVGKLDHVLFLLGFTLSPEFPEELTYHIVGRRRLHFCLRFSVRATDHEILVLCLKDLDLCS
jgi:hypothetical protein